MKASKPQRVRQDNLAFLIGTIQADGPLSQREIANLTKLSVVTVNKLIPVLLAAGMIRESSHSVVTGGRRAISYDYNETYQLLLAIQLIEENHQFYINFYRCDLNGTILFQEKRLGHTLSWIGIKEVIHDFMTKYPKIAAIIIGIPGVEKEGVSQMIDYPPLMAVNIRKELNEAFNLPVMIENDINAAVFGCAKHRAESGDTLIGLYYPKEFPPGAGIFLNGKIVKGRNGFAGEIKYLPLAAFNQWDQVPVRKIDVKANLSEVVQSLMCLYDPDEVVVYTNNQRISESDLREIKERLRRLFPGLDLPRFYLSSEFNQDYLQGLIAQGIELIESNYLNPVS